MSSSSPLFTDTPSDSDSFAEAVKSSTNAATATAIISSVIGAIALVAIVYYIVRCLNKTGDALPDLANAYTSRPGNSSTGLQSHANVIKPVPVFPRQDLERDGELDFETMERFMKPKRFSSDELSTFTEGYTTTLGSGSYGVVFKGQLSNGLPVAVKVLSNGSDKRIEEQFMAEVSSIGRTHHINLVRLYGFCFDPPTRALVYEFMPNGSLDRLLFGEGFTLIRWPKLLEIAIGTAKGITYLHEECQERIVHYDIKPGNVLLDKNLTPKVADFGLAKLCNRESTRIPMTGFRGTPGYAAPELWRPFPVTFKCDVYSYGMLLFEIVGQRKNLLQSNQPESRQWLPRWTWNMLQQNELRVMVSLLGIGEEDRAEAERMLTVALLCIQYLPETRPLMSSVVKMLEGHMDIPLPGYPFEYLDPVKPYSGTQEGSTFNTDDSTIRTVYSDGSCSKPRDENNLQLVPNNY